MFNRFTAGAKHAMGQARREALNLNHDYIGTEHILLALANGGSSVATTVLQSFELDHDLLRQEVEELSRPGVPVTAEQLPFTPGSRRLLEQAVSLAAELGHGYVGTEHLLMALLQLEDSAAFTVLCNLGLNPRTVHTALVARLQEAPPPPGPASRSQMVTLLAEIRDELKAIRRLLEDRSR